MLLMRSFDGQRDSLLAGPIVGTIGTNVYRLGPGLNAPNLEFSAHLSGVNYFFSLTTTISLYRRQLLFDS